MELTQDQKRIVDGIARRLTYRKLNGRSWETKWLIDTFSGANFDDLKRDYPQYKTVWWFTMDWIEKTAAKQKMTTTVSDGAFKKVFDAVWKQIAPTIDENVKTFLKYMEDRLRRLAAYYEEQTLRFKGVDPAIRNHPLHREYNQFLNDPDRQNGREARMILASPQSLRIHLENAEKRYRENEQAKVERLLYKTFEKLGNVIDAKVGRYTNHTLTMKVNTDTEKGIDVVLFAIPSGGYNIQRFHYRWLIRFTKDGKTHEIRATER